MVGSHSLSGSVKVLIPWSGNILQNALISFSVISLGDGEDDEHLVPAGLENDDRRPVITVKGDRSHLIVWQVTLTEWWHLCLI